MTIHLRSRIGYYVLNMKTPNTSDYLTLQEVADELGVHYMTVYRYVRIGILPARKKGRSWQVTRADLDGLNTTPAAEPATAAPWPDRLIRRSIAGDEAGAWQLIESALSGGMTPQAVLTEIMAPAMVRIGEMWLSGRIGIDEEHTASTVCMRLVARIGSRFARRGVSKGTVVMGTTEHELHALPAAIASEYIRQEGYDVIELGALLPPADFARAAARAERLVAVGVSATLTDQTEALRETVAALRNEVDAPVFVGGAAISSQEQAAAVGADAWAADAADFARRIAVDN